jgi:hypothetical protein
MFELGVRCGIRKFIQALLEGTAEPENVGLYARLVSWPHKHLLEMGLALVLEGQTLSEVEARFPRTHDAWGNPLVAVEPPAPIEQPS